MDVKVGKPSRQLAAEAMSEDPAWRSIDLRRHGAGG